jgi:hypothetical protein
LSLIFVLDISYDIEKDLFATVFKLGYSFNNASDSLVDLVRDQDENVLSTLIPPFVENCKLHAEAMTMSDSCGYIWGWDAVHPNSFSRAKDGSERFVYSLRHTSQIILLDRNFVARQVIGGHGTNPNTYRFPNPADRFSGQHRAVIEADGSLLLFDNGWKGVTRALKLSLVEASMEARAVWQFNLTKFSGQSHRCCGSAIMNAAGNVITHDANPHGFDFFNIYEADGTKDDTPVAIVTLEKNESIPVYWMDENVIYRTDVEDDIDGEAVICQLEKTIVVQDFAKLSVDIPDSFELGVVIAAVFLVLFCINCRLRRRYRVESRTKF